MKKLFIGSILFLGVTTSFGQSTGEIYQFSKNSFTLNTARSAAMAGAYTSLGADAATMYINPAGLAMYSKSEVAVTPSLLINQNRVTSSMEKSAQSLTKGVVSNLSGIYSNGKFAFGIGYNRVADYEGKYTYRGADQNVSIGQVYMEQLYGVDYNNLSSPKGNEYRAFYKYPPIMWNAIMGYQSGLLNPTGNGDTYNMAGVFDYQYGDLLAPYTTMRTGGSMNEFTISGAYNVKDLIYFGLTLGVPSLNYSESFQYHEYGSLDNYGNLDNYYTGQTTKITGSGFNFKVGVTVRPVEWLRVGVAYHSPSWMNLYESSYYDAQLYQFGVSGYGYSDTPYLENNYSTFSPSRLLVGASATVAKRLIVSFDYERTWYNQMGYGSQINTIGLRMPNQFSIIDNYPTYVDNINSNGDLNLNSMVSNNYRATNNYRVGIEAQPTSGFFLRAGYSFSESPYSDNIMNMYSADMLKDFGIKSIGDLRKFGESYQVTGGIGYRTRGFGFDLTYVYGHNGVLPKKSFYYNAPDVNNTVYNLQSVGVADFVNEIHQVMLTILFKF